MEALQPHFWGQALPRGLTLVSGPGGPARRCRQGLNLPFMGCSSNDLLMKENPLGAASRERAAPRFLISVSGVGPPYPRSPAGVPAETEPLPLPKRPPAPSVVPEYKLNREKLQNGPARRGACLLHKNLPAWPCGLTRLPQLLT
ncbi:hypothetical protein NDU88_006879 [Pleurodeles waltl]|uniref:Uncharacterized protein n=1 Tax=Pleurodeles waltl TaxID=8319 RepID=A0AAV7SR65_PLEWA|nr:hypothetical protein NDU88_006879 [Pleurodeles waltl]